MALQKTYDTSCPIMQMTPCYEHEEDYDVVIIMAIASLGSLDARKNRFYLTRPVLISPSNRSAAEKAFIILTTGLTPESFNYGLDCGFRGRPIYVRSAPFSSSLDADGALGLTRVPEALILWPKKPDFESAFFHGLAPASRASGDMDAQNAYYNGWVHAYFTTDVFVFSPVSTILYGAI
ncbi:hypothetical protein V1524DRAFT_467881 [Lipomyces starkeyi]